MHRLIPDAPPPFGSVTLHGNHPKEKFSLQEQAYIYVIGLDGRPQMPTRRHRHVKKLLNTGKARIVEHVPYTIQLLYENSPVLQPLQLTENPGRTNIGIAVLTEQGKLVFSASAETRNKEIHKLMEKRKQHRQNSRAGERKARQRLARKHGTTLKEGHLDRKLPYYKEEKPVTCKDIRNTEARYCNRKRKSGWLTPTVEHLVRTHLNLVHKVQRFLPITDIALEINRFAFALLDDPSATGIDFQTGPLKGYDDIHAAVSDQQHGVCLLCGKEIEAFTYIVPKAKGGSETLANVAGVCNCCLKKLHTDQNVREELKQLKEGQLKKYGALSAINQAIPYICERLIRECGSTHVQFCTGGETYHMRELLGYTKEQAMTAPAIDAYVIGLVSLGIIPEEKPDFTFSHQIRQFRRQDRSIIKSQRERTYKYHGATVAKNRNSRFQQTGPSLADWYQEMCLTYGTVQAEKMCSQLTVVKSTRRYNNLNRLYPGTVFYYRGERHVMSGQLSNGLYLRAVGDSKTNYKAKECWVAKRNAGVVFVE